MRKMNLIRLDAKDIDFDKIKEMRNTLQELQDLDFNSLSKEEVFDYVREIVSFQDSDGSFKLIDSYEIESDGRVEICYEPTYMCTAFLMKAFLYNSEILTGKEDIILTRALNACTARKLKGHGYDDTVGQLKAMHIFINAGVNDFIKRYPTLSDDFTDMIKEIVNLYSDCLESGRVYGKWGEDYSRDFSEIVNCFR